LNLFADPTVAFHISQPPEKPAKPEGPESGKTGETYTFTTNTNDPDDDSICYLFDWDDGTDSGWLGPYSNGGGCEATYTWNKKGDYKVKVIARDVNYEVSEWSDTLSIGISKKSREIRYLSRDFIRFPSLFKMIKIFQLLF
jgi:hypothetical protein